MTDQEKKEAAAKAAAEKKANAKPAKETKLVKPEIIHIIGSIVAQNYRTKSEKFKHNTHILILEDLKEGKTHEVFITEAQWDAYGLKGHIYPNNIINVSFEDNIEGVTGYFEDAEDDEMTAHDKSFKSFNGITNLSLLQLDVQLSRLGLADRSIDRQLDAVKEARALYDTQTGNAARALRQSNLVDE